MLQPEAIHKVIFFILRIAAFCPGMRALIKAIFQFKNKKLEREVFGIKFPNPVGLGAGLDKNAELPDMFGYMGFGFVEIGTVTPVAQPGNEQPRVFRLKNDKALINRMGFNNGGSLFMVDKLKQRKSKVIIGGNIGK